MEVDMRGQVLAVVDLLPRSAVGVGEEGGSEHRLRRRAQGLLLISMYAISM